jgi:hypothetical protein
MGMIPLTPAKTAVTGVGDHRRGLIQVILLLVQVSGLALAVAAAHLRVDTLYPIQQNPVRDSRVTRPSLARAKAVAVAASHRVRMVVILTDTPLSHDVPAHLSSRKV